MRITALVFASTATFLSAWAVYTRGWVLMHRSGVDLVQGAQALAMIAIAFATVAVVLCRRARHEWPVVYLRGSVLVAFFSSAAGIFTWVAPL